MRFVPTVCLRKGMIVGKRLYNQSGQVLIYENTELKQYYIDRIKNIGYTGIYINDDISKDIEIKNVVDGDFRIKAVQSIKKIFIESVNKDKISNINVAESKYLIENIVEDILHNNDLIVNIIDIKVFDDYTYYHSLNVAILSIIIGVSLGLKKESLYKLGLGALLHDIGKVFISKEILNKKEKLTEKEYNEIKRHPQLGYEYLKKNGNITPKSYIAALQHHERFDGTGYPHRKKGKKISLFGRIIAIADIYDALTSDRPYRKALLPSEAIEYIMANGNSMFDTDLVKIFVTKIAPYPVGMFVKLSNNMTGIVCKNYEDAIMRPQIKIVKDKNDEIIEPFVIDLRNDKYYFNVTIVQIVNI